MESLSIVADAVAMAACRAAENQQNATRTSVRPTSWPTTESSESGRPSRLFTLICASESLT